MQSKNIKLEFLGGAGTVTGSKAVIRTDNHQIMVDCGLFQGLKNLRERNWKAIAVEPSQVEHLILTHAHLDHSGYIPVFVKNGFNGDIHCTPATKKLCELLLLDSARIQEEDAENANKFKYTKHAPAKPLYTEDDVKNCLSKFVTHEYGEWIILNEDFKFSLHNAGHIAGSAWTEIRCQGQKIVFSGDLGRQHPLLLLPPHRCEEADYLILESTYGSKQHQDHDLHADLSSIIVETLKRNGQVLIPAFAVERTQEILYLLGELYLENRIPKVPVYIDSPMAISATEIFMDFKFKKPLDPRVLEELNIQLKLIRSAGDSKKLIAEGKMGIVIAGSGMLNGGRILHHLEKHISNENAAIILTGYQAEGTRGRQLLQGLPELKFFGKYHKVNAQVHKIHGLSAHADQSEIMLWLKRISKKPKRIFINHGEPLSSDPLRVKIQDSLDIPSEVVELEKTYLL